jgi:regulator of protease activity HflC (stomatin/prohibitin superfamily)
MAIVFVQPQENAVVISALAPDGIRPRSFGAGIHAIVPFVERVQRYPIFNQHFSISASGFERGLIGVDDTISSRSSDGQEIFMDVSVIFRIDPDSLNEVHILWQDRYTEDLVRPLVRGLVRGSASQLRAEEIYSSGRFEMEEAIFHNISEVMERNGFITQTFILRNITFNDEYSHAVEQKVIAAQEAERAKIVISRKVNEAEQIRTLAQGEADAVVIKAQADAEALALVNQVLEQNPQVLDYEYIKRLAPNVELLLLNSDNPVILPLTTGATRGETVSTNPLIPQMPPSSLAPDGDGSPLEPQMPPSGLAPDAEIGEDESPYSGLAAEAISSEELEDLRPPVGQ